MWCGLVQWLLRERLGSFLPAPEHCGFHHTDSTLALPQALCQGRPGKGLE